MSQVLVVFESHYGQAEKIAAFTRDLLTQQGLAVTLARVDTVRPREVAISRAYVVVAPIYFGRHPRAMRRFLRANGTLLSARPTAFVSVSNSAGSADLSVRAEARRTAEAALAALGVRPRMVITTGGALAYPRYGFILRRVMKAIARRAGNSQDVSRTHELTDWASLERGLREFLGGTGLFPVTPPPEPGSLGAVPSAGPALAP